ncbi:GNAT family N-acetyltransferase [Actomonas aquatica]|uniref:GNAT family N-acyltransferase n=1 Tax=Actomonas aquatica TaxID=2866162 RepID=A0ABZ1C748_9BACT|nr:GNAT family N-acyltransferase [Opitutus sp. WL0086]WRQ87157.1 GNAT family N-acyltransferase [Opitutus sp. WL0086]
MKTIAAPIEVETERYVLRMGTGAEDLAAAQRLRFEVFNLELQRGLVESYASGRDEDRFDAVCDLMLVMERDSGAVVGTYRMQTGLSAAQHLGYYSGAQFDLSPMEPARHQILELGRACVAEAHRNQTVIGLLWKGIARYAQAHGARYLVGCSSLISQDAGAGMGTYEQLAKRYLVEEPWRTRPLADHRCDVPASEPAKVPKLMAAYLMLGARICGEPSLHREFGTIEFLTWLDLDGLAPRVARKFLG